MDSGPCLKYLKVSLYVKYWIVVTITTKQPNKTNTKPNKNPIRWIFLPVQHLTRYLRVCIVKWEECWDWLIWSYLTHIAEIIFMFLSIFLPWKNLIANKSVTVSLYSILSYNPCIAGSADLDSTSLLRLFCWIVTFKKILRHLSCKYYASWREWHKLLFSLYIKKIKRCSCQLDNGNYHVLLSSFGIR